MRGLSHALNQTIKKSTSTMVNLSMLQIIAFEPTKVCQISAGSEYRFVIQNRMIFDEWTKRTSKKNL